MLAPAGALQPRPGPGVAMTSELDIFVGNTTLIDEDVYRLWLDGYSGVWGAVCGAAQKGRLFGLGEGAEPGLGRPMGRWAERVRDVSELELGSSEGLWVRPSRS